MAGIRLLEKNAVNINLIVNELIKPEIRYSFFDDCIGANDVYFYLMSQGTYIYGIFEKGDPIPIGVVYFSNVIPYRDGILSAVIFDKKNRNEHKITKVCEEIKADIINRVSLHSCSANIIGKNPVSEKLLANLGFKKIGVKPKKIMANGKFVDQNEYYLLLEKNKTKEK